VAHGVCGSSLCAMAMAYSIALRIHVWSCSGLANVCSLPREGGITITGGEGLSFSIFRLEGVIHV
jgi:hypothetical protein